MKLTSVVALGQSSLAPSHDQYLQPGNRASALKIRAPRVCQKIEIHVIRKCPPRSAVRVTLGESPGRTAGLDRRRGGWNVDLGDVLAAVLVAANEVGAVWGALGGEEACNEGQEGKEVKGLHLEQEVRG